MSSDEQTRQITAGCIVGISLGLGAIGLLVLKLLNCRKTIKREDVPPPLEGWKKWVVFFFKDVLLELVCLVYGIYSIYQLATGAYESIDVSRVAIAYYIFFALRYFLIIYLILEEQIVQVKNVSIRVANTGWVPRNWAEMAESWIFVPSIIIDGILYNCDYKLHQSGSGDFTPYDSLALMILDTILFIKFGILDALKAYTHGYWYKVMAIFYAMCEFIYTICLIFLCIFINLCDLMDTNSITPTRDFILVLVVALLHPVISRFTGMARQGIKAITSSFLLRETPKIRLYSLKAYVYLFDFHAISLLISAALYGTTFYLYISIWFITAAVRPRIEARQEVVIQGVLIGLLILVNIFTVFYMINLAYALLKRLSSVLSLGCGLNCAFPFDCSTYAKAMNRGLSKCNANFLMNTHMQVS